MKSNVHADYYCPPTAYYSSQQGRSDTMRRSFKDKAEKRGKVRVQFAFDGVDVILNF